MHGFSQDELAEKIGVSRQTLSKYETGESLPDIERGKLCLLYTSWNRYVCIVSPRRWPRLLRRSDTGRLCIQHVFRRSEKRNPCSDCFSGVTDCRNSVVREETGSEIKNNEKIREDSPCLVKIPLFLGGFKKRSRYMKEYQNISHGFGPVYNRESRILILGSFPSVKSREQAFFYGRCV